MKSKKIVLIIMCLLLSLQIVSCGGEIHCRERGCEDPNVYKSGYCETHYSAHSDDSILRAALFGIGADYAEPILLGGVYYFLESLFE